MEKRKGGKEAPTSNSFQMSEQDIPN